MKNGGLEGWRPVTYKDSFCIKVGYVGKDPRRCQSARGSCFKIDATWGDLEYQDGLPVAAMMLSIVMNTCLMLDEPPKLHGDTQMTSN